MPSKTGRGTARTDVFPNFYKAAVVTQVADTATYVEWLTGFSIKDGFGFVIHRIEYTALLTTIALPNADGDCVGISLSTRNDLTHAQILGGTIDSVIDNHLLVHKMATAVGQSLMDTKYIHDFTNEPGGGRLVAPKPLYFNITSAGCGAALVGFNVKVVYTMLKLSESYYRELYESMNPSA